MSKVIDERVVSMQFDNKHFESNVKTTMSTLDKLKQSLNLSGASKGLENVSAAASKCNLSPLSNAAEAVKVKFSAMEVMAITALTNITNSAVNAGKQMVKSLTITPITTGFNEYELKMGAIQTIMASTGEDLATVNEYLNELNEYSDQTIYSFQDMTQNIGKFTNAGVKLEDAVLAIKGIANEAAVSGANANEASRAMYNFAQALSTGYVQRIDWKSIELANMATVEFKEQLLNSAVAMGTVKKNAEGMWQAVGDDTWYNTSQMFIESLDEQWLTSEVLIDTLKDYADETTDIGKKAKAAATEVKTFSMMMDTLRESAQSGWATTWETIVGDFNESKSLFTSLSEVIGNMLNKSAKRRNNFLSEVLDSNWEKAVKQLNEAGVSTEEFEEAIKGVAKNSKKAQKTLDDQGKTLEELIEEYGSLKDIFEAGIFDSDILVDAVDKVITEFEELELTIDGVFKRGTKGDDIKQIQKILKAWGADLGEFGENLDGIDGSFGPVTQAAVRAFQEAKGLTVDGIVGPETLAALEKAADELNAANKDSKGLVGNIKDLVKNVDELGGRKKLLEAFSTLWEKLSKVMDAVKEGWKNVFGEMDLAGNISGAIDKFSDWVDEIKIGKEALSDITSIVEGFASAIQTGAILGSGVFGILYKIVSTATRFVGLDLLSVLGDIGDALVKFRQFLVSDNALANWLESVGTILATGLETVYAKIGEWSNRIREWFKGFKEFQAVATLLDLLRERFTIMSTELMTWFGGFGPIFTKFFDAISSLDEITFDGIVSALETLWQDIVDHFGELGDIFEPLIHIVKLLGQSFIDYIGIGDSVFGTLVTWIKTAHQSYKDWCDGLAGSEDLPKRVAESIVKGIGGALLAVIEIVKNLGLKIWSALTGTDIDMTAEGEKMSSDIITGIANGIWNGIKFVGEALVELAKAIVKAFTGELQIESPSKVFIALGGFIIAGLIAGLLNGTTSIGEAITNIGNTIKDTFANFDLGNLFAAGVVTAMVFIIKKIVDTFEKLAEPMTTVNDILKNFKGIAGGVKDTIKSLGGALTDWGKSLKIKAITGGIKDIAISIALLVAAVWLLTTVEDTSKIWTAVNAIIALATVLILVSASIEKAGASGLDTAGFASIVLAFGIVVILIGRVVKKLGELTPGQCEQGIFALSAITAVIIGLMWATNLIVKTTSKSKAGIQGADANLKQIGGVLIKMALAMIVMSVALKMLGKMKQPELIQGGIALIVLAGIIVGLMAATRLLTKSCTTKGTQGVDKNIDIIGGTILKIGAALVIMAIALKILGSMERDDLIEGGIAMVVLAGIIVGLMAATRLLARTTTTWGSSIKENKNIDKNLSQVGGMILKIGAAMLLMAVALKLLGSMDLGELVQGGVAMIVLAGIVVGLMAATNLIVKSCTTKGTKNIDGNITQIGKTLFAIGGAMVLMAIAAKAMGSMDWDELGKAVAGMVVLSGIIVGLIAATKLAAGGDNLKRVGTTLLMIGTTLLLMSACMLILSLMSWDGIAKGLVGITGLSLLIAILIQSTKDAKDVKGSLIGIAIVIGVITACLILLSLLNTKKLLGASAALTMVTGVFALLIYSTKFINTGKKTFARTLITLGVLTLVVGALTACLMLLSKCDAQSVLGSAIALSVLLIALSTSMSILNKFSKTKPEKMLMTLGAVTLVVGALSLILYLLKDLNPVQATASAVALSAFLYILIGAVTLVSKIKTVSTTALVALGVMTLVVGALGLILHLLRDLDPIQAIGTATALSVILLALSAAITILNSVKSVSVMALVAAGVMTLVVGALSVILYLLRDLDPIQAIGTATALSVLLLALSAACVILSKAVTVTPMALAAAGVMTLVVGALGVILYLLRDLDPTQAIGVAIALSTLLLALSAACGILALVGLGGPAALIGIGSLMALVVALGTLIVGIGALVEKFPQLETFLDTGIPILEKIGYALGSFFGNVLGGFLGGVTAGLPQMGADLGAFMLNATPFIVGAKMIDSAALEGIKTIAEMILTLTAANILDGIASLFTGDSSLIKFGSELAEFGSHLKVFADSVVGIDTAAVTAAANAAKTLCEMANTIPNEGGMVSWFAGENSLAAFGPQISAFGGYLKSFADNVTGVDPATITAAANAGKALAEMANTIPNEGGMAAWFAGENSLATFSANLPGFGTNLAAFATNLGTFTDAQVSTITCASDAITTLANATNTIPNEGGLAAWFAGENSLATFSANLPGLGTNLASFVTNLGTFTEAQQTTIKCAADALTAIATASNTIPNEGGLAAWFAGDNSIASFSSQFPGLGTNLAGFVTNLGTFTDAQVATVRSAVNALKAFGELADSDLKNANKHFDDFGDNLVELGNDLADFCGNLGENVNVSGAVERLNAILDAIKNITSNNVSIVRDLGDAMADFAKNGVSKFVSALTSEAAKTDVENAASKLAGKMVDGFELKESDVNDAAKALATNAAESIETWAIKEDWKDAGKYVVKGFAAGIEAQTWQAEAKAKAMAKAALKAAEEELDENSPSKEFYKIGAFAGKGFVNALGDYATAAYDASAEMASEAKSGLSNTISKIANVIESDLDSQPTIRPVMDLSDIKSGVNTIGNMMDLGATVGVTANAGTISAMMNSRIQNGTNDDVISAINRLGRELSNVGGTSYNINGITYDDGSSTSDAVRSLVRAIGMERRV